MKMKRFVIVSISLVVLIATGFCAWWFFPTTFLKNAEADSISKIDVFDGRSGNGFTIEDADEIEQIVRNIQNIRMHKEKLSVGYKGYAFRLKIYDENGNKIEELIINGDDAMRKDPFFYKNRSGGLCFDYLNELENKYAENRES